MLVLPASTRPAAAHPHVWVTVKTELAYAGGGRLASVRHQWTFDEAYSAFAVQGLDKNGDGALSQAELSELAKVNVESLHEFDFFTFAKAGGTRQDFGRPTDYKLTYDKARLTLHFTLPMRQPATTRPAFTVEIYDPTWFVSFEFVPGDDAVTLADAPAGCARTVTRPKPVEAVASERLSESFFESLAGSGFGANFANRVLVACP
jgi:ABC-type uncharacterized transport system substrate-binding protein